MDILKLTVICGLILACSGCGKQESKESLAQRATVACAGRLNGFVIVKKRWAQDHSAALTDTPTLDDLAPYFRRGLRECPEGGTYTIGAVGELPQCSIAAHNEYFKAHPVSAP
jgi:hypothetical protein